MNTYLIVLLHHTVWEVQAADVADALAQYRQNFPRALGRHLGVFLQVVPPHRIATKDEPVKIADVTGAHGCACCLHGVSHHAAQDALGRKCKTCGHIFHVHRNTEGGPDDRSNPEPG